MSSFTTACYHWAKQIIQPILRDELEAFVGRLLYATPDAIEGGMDTIMVCEPVPRALHFCERAPSASAGPCPK